MAKAMTLVGMVVAVLMVLTFGLDLIVGAPFGGVSWQMDVGLLVSGLILGYMGYSAFRDTK